MSSNDFLDYFLSLKGIKNINYKNDDYLEITIQYTDDISLEDNDLQPFSQSQYVFK